MAWTINGGNLPLDDLEGMSCFFFSMIDVECLSNTGTDSQLTETAIFSSSSMYSGTYLDSWHFLLGSDALQTKRLNQLSKIIKIAGYIVMFLDFSLTNDLEN